MDAAAAEDMVSRIAAAIGEPARARILCCLMDNHARTSTELAVVAGVSPSTASAHLTRLKTARLVRLHIQGRHRYYSLGGPDVAQVLEGLHVLAGGPQRQVVPRTPVRLRTARTCYDHIAGTLGVLLHDRLVELGWICPGLQKGSQEGLYEITADGSRGLAGLSIDVGVMSALRRRLAYGCLDWSERRCHLGGALGAALLEIALKRRWVTRDLDGRGLSISGAGRRDMLKVFGLRLP
jgi:DNA-binding transcriptional ArsR family regulator